MLFSGLKILQKRSTIYFKFSLQYGRSILILKQPKNEVSRQMLTKLNSEKKVTRTELTERYY